MVLAQSELVSVLVAEAVALAQLAAMLLGLLVVLVVLEEQFLYPAHLLHMVLEVLVLLIMLQQAAHQPPTQAMAVHVGAVVKTVAYPLVELV